MNPLDPFALQLIGGSPLGEASPPERHLQTPIESWCWCLGHAQSDFFSHLLGIYYFLGVHREKGYMQKDTAAAR